ncbi:anti-anti-sigma factor [Mycobacterium avium 10-5581]|nr:anti-anti-sigma factor [Mycobacterium avium 10-5581]
MRATRERRGAALIASVGGEVDASNNDASMTLLHTMTAACPPPGALVIDLCQMQFVSGTALRVLTRHAHRCRS